MTQLVAHPAGVILIQESITGNTCGLPLFHHLLGKFTSKKQLYFLAAENNVSFHESKLKISGTQYIDVFTDPLSWASPSTAKQNNTILCNYTSLQNIIQALPPINETENAVLAIDSLSPLLFYHGITKVCQFLNLIKTKFSSIVCLLHRELHDEKIYKQLEYLSTYNLELFEPKDLNATSLYIVSVLHKRVSGKVTDVLENYSYSHDGQVTITNTHKHGGKVSGAEKKEEDPAANLTFNLKLTAQERSAREEVQLPYIHQEKNTPVVEDDEDDEYEEDPDDDLDI